MEKKRPYQYTGSESESLSENNSCSYSEKKKFSYDKKCRKTNKPSEPNSNKEFVSDSVEYKRYKHKQRKRKHDKILVNDASTSEGEGNSHTVDYDEEIRKKHHRRNKNKKSSQNFGGKEAEKQTSKWEKDDDKVNQLRIKSEPISDHELENNNEDYANRRSRRNSISKCSNYEQRRENLEIKKEEHKIKEEVENKEKINFGLSGKLVEDSNTYNGIVIKYSQPPEARKPKRRWRWYIFKGEDELPFLPLHRQSAYLIGRERKVADIPTDHPSCSKQHAVIQYRLVSYDRTDGTKGRTVKPYIIDLESANGTYVNNRRIDPRKYVELLEKDVVKFGYSSREYVLLHESSKDSDEDLPDTGAEMSPFSLLRSH